MGLFMSISLIIDIGVLLIVFVSAGVSFFRGFVREVLTIFGVIGGAAAAWTFGPKLSPVFRGWFGVEEGKPVEKMFDVIPYNYVADICAYGAIFLAVFLILQLISYFMSASVKAVGLGPVDRSLGVIFGIARALLFLGIIYAVVGSIFSNEQKKEVLGESKTIVYIDAVADWLKGFMPGNSEKSAKENVSSGLQELKSGVEQKVQDHIEEPLKEKASGYTDRAREKMDALIENENATPPERSAPHE